jgi:hypothetical protein
LIFAEAQCLLSAASRAPSDKKNQQGPAIVRKDSEKQSHHTVFLRSELTGQMVAKENATITSTKKTVMAAIEISRSENQTARQPNEVFFFIFLFF